MKKIIKRIFLTLAAAVTIFFIYLMLSVPNISNYTYREPTSTQVISADGVVIGEISGRNTTYVTREEIPDQLVYAVIAIEDKRFYKNSGVDLRSIIRAMWENLIAGEIVEGGSTITQQLAKLLFFTDEQSYIRKAKEALTVIKLTNKYTKDEIIAMYLNEIYMGGGAFGMAEAADTYFSKTLDELTLGECAMLAGIITAPSAYCPLTDEGYAYACERKDKVLDAMCEQGYISREEADAAKAETVHINPSSENYFGSGVCREGYEGYMNRVFEEAVASIAHYYHTKLGYSESKAYEMAESALFSQNLKIQATLSDAMQQNALDAIDSVAPLSGENGDAAFISIDNLTGNVLAYYGSSTYVDTVQNPRQPGSTVKPLYMSYLIESGLADRNTVVNDERVTISDYSPRNAGDKYYGYVTLRDALAYSLNSACLRLFSLANVTELVDFVASKFAITTITDQDYNASFALGGLYTGIKPVELACAYATFGNGGVLYEPRYIVSVTDGEGKIIFARENPGAKVLSSETAAQIKSCLESVVIRGTGTSAASGWLTYGKTGTTDDNKDVWFVGSTGNVTSAVWIGSIAYESVSGLSSAKCAALYKKYVSACIAQGKFNTAYLEKTRAEDMVAIMVVKEPGKTYTAVTQDDIVSVSVPVYERAQFAAVEVVSVDIDSSTGLLFVAGVCPQKYKETRLYLRKDAPTTYCNKRHYTNGWFDWLDDLF